MDMEEVDDENDKARISPITYARGVGSLWATDSRHSDRSLDGLFDPKKEQSQNKAGEIKEGRGSLGIVVSERWGKLKIWLLDKRLADEAIRTALTASVFICIIGLMVLAQMFSDRWFDLYSRNLMMTNDKGETPLFFNSTALNGMNFAFGNTTFATDPLFDHVFTLLPDKSVWRTWLPDAMLDSFLVISLIVTFCFPAHTRLKFQAAVVARRVMWILSLLYLFRMCSFMVTTVPNPVHSCVPKYPQDPTAYLSLMGHMATGKISACTDNIYSAHTTLVTVIFFTNLIYSGRWYFSIYSFLHGVTVLFTILLTRLHYSVDVLIALFMTSFIYCLYHFLLLIHIDQLVFTSSRLKWEDQRLLNERRLLTRLTNNTTIQVLAWMDGMDLRMTPLELPIHSPQLGKTIDNGAGVNNFEFYPVEGKRTVKSA